MICVAISSEDTSAAIEKSQKAIERGADFIEVRIDHFSDPFSADFAKLVEKIESKLILTVRKPEEGGQFAFQETQRLELISKCIKAKPYAVDIESSILKENLVKLIQETKDNSVQTILSFHDFKKTPEIDDMKLIILNAVKLKVNIVKIIGTAKSIEDNLKMLTLPQFAKENNIEIIAFVMGRKGTVSRVLSPIFGAKFTFAALDKPTAPGQISIGEMKKNLESFTSYSKG